MEDYNCVVELEEAQHDCNHSTRQGKSEEIVPNHRQIPSFTIASHRSLQEQVYYEGPVELGFAGAKPQLRAMPISSRSLLVTSSLLTAKNGDLEWKSFKTHCIRS
ncbi:hypothetical protein PGTUg99_025082 [Puccinia graminis f. sp. tritici]|uniref:Uncharacterized protein n=1 Tax=Puccinia graminis f. sp. tritici TaxID=56615 RepID=A0A5B0RF03_PUCGR|nr:hypothetical protein PGTUg99_025082 [Puccinia graminis f. sp. tritici]